jgi:hypothetical protein
MLARTSPGLDKTRVSAGSLPETFRMKRAVVVLMLGIFEARAEVWPAECSSYYISEINIVSVADTDAGNVQTYVGFGQSAEEAQKNAMGACSHLKFDIETCLESDLRSGRNALSDASDNSLHLKYTKAVRRITGCS